MRRYWSCCIWEAIACLAASAALVLNFSQGFYIPDAVADSVPLALLVCGVTTVCCYLGGFNRKTAVGVILGFLAVAAGFFLWMRRTGIDIVDQEGSPTAVYIYCIAAPVIAVLVYLLSRSRLGMAMLFLLGACLHGLIGFLGFEVKIWCAALFALAMVVLFWMRQYRAAAIAGGAAAPAFGQCFGLAGGMALAGLAMAGLCWVLVIQPLHPPTLDLELLTKYMQYEILEMVGIAKQYPELDQEVTAQEEDQTMLADEPEPEPEPEAPPETQPLEETAPSQTSPDPDRTTDVSAVTYERNMTGPIAVMIVLVILIILLIPVLVRALRKRRMKRLARGEPWEQAVALYRFYLQRFARIGYARSPSETEREYAARCGEHLAPYLKGGVDLERMTELYLDARYGGIGAQEDCQTLADVYPLFLRNYREQVGRWRYVMKYFVL